MPKRRLSTEQVMAIRELRASGAAVKELAAQYGVVISVIYGIVSGRTRVSARGNYRLTFAQVRQIRARRAAGEKVVDLAQEFDVCTTTMHGILMNRRYFDPEFIPIRMDKAGNRLPPRPNDYRG